MDLRSVCIHLCSFPECCLWKVTEEKKNKKEKKKGKGRKGNVSYNGSSSPLPLEEQLFPVSEKED